MTTTALRHLLAALAFLVLAGTGAFAQSLPSFPGMGAATTDATEAPAGQAASLDELIGILEDEATRARLIESLRSLAYQPQGGGSETAAEASTLEAPSVPAMLASYTRSAIAALQMAVGSVADVATSAGRLVSGAQSLDVPRVMSAILPVFSVALATFAAYFGLSFLQRPILDWIAGRAKPKMPLLRLGLLALATGVSVLKIFLSGITGHVAAFVFDSGPPNYNQALFLNAFVITGLLQVALSAFSAPFHPPLRMTPFSDGQARYWYVRLSFLILLLGYAFLFIAPVVEANSSYRAANGVRFAAVTLAFLTMVTLIVLNRNIVRQRLHRRAVAGDDSFQARVNYLIGHVWAPFALIFVLALYSLWVSSPSDGFRFMLSASLISLGAITLGGLLITVLTRAITAGIKVPAGTSDRLPLLERRVNAFIPRFLFVLRTIVIILVFAAVLEAWSVFSARDWLASEWGQRAVGGGIGALFVLAAGFVAYLLVSSWVEYRLNPNYGTVPTARERTLLSLFRNAFTLVLGILTLMLFLSQVGINIAPLLAGAGVVGLAIGFGAQKLVQDIITGAFIQVENVMNEGDVVQVGAISGVVEKLTIRSVSLRSLDGTYHLIPFSVADQVSNMTKDFSNFVADVDVAYRENIDEVRAAMEEAFQLLRDSEQGINVIADFEFMGVEILGVSSITVRARIKCLPGKQWGVGRLYKQLIKQILDERRIEIPFPQTTVWFGTGKDGSAPPLRTLAADTDAQHAEIARARTKVRDALPPATISPVSNPT